MTTIVARARGWRAVMTNRTRCVLPGCQALVDQQGMPCQECVENFGSYLARGVGPAMTAEQQRSRDAEAIAQYALQTNSRIPVQPLRKANQRCWLCEDRRTCTQVRGRWECAACQQVH